MTGAVLVAGLFGGRTSANLRVVLGGLAQGRAQRLQARGKSRRAHPWLLLAGLISWYDLTRALAPSRVSVALQFLGVALVILALPVSPVVGFWAWLFFLLGMVTALTSFAVEVSNLRKTDVLYQLVPVRNERRFKAGLHACVADPGKLFAFRESFFEYSTEVNDGLAMQSRMMPGGRVCAESSGRSRGRCAAASMTVVEYGRTRIDLHEKAAKARQQILLNKYDHKVRPFNGDLVSQRTTLTANLLTSGGSVRMFPTTYFDLMCSNYLADSLVEQDKHVVIDGLSLMTDKQGCLLPLEDSELADGVGVSTLAFDPRRRLILIQQSNHALSEAGRWAPSGSGSLEPQDIQSVVDFDAGSAPLVSVVRAGMNRELVEESNIRPGVILDSRVIGYFRWLEKGGKPEYVGVTLLGRLSLPLRRSIFEWRWVKGIEVGVEVDFDALRANPNNAGRCLGSTPEEVLSYRRRMSTPLYVGLRFLGERLRDDEEFSSWFFESGLS